MIPDRLKLPFSFSPADLEADLARLEQNQWIDHFVTRNYEGNWSAVALRMPAKAVGMHPVATLFSHWSDGDWIDAPWLEQTPCFQEVLRIFECPLEAVRLMRLTPGSHIKEHCDAEMGFEDGHVRLHIPVRTNDAVEFYLNGERAVMAVGECWYLRLSDPHRVHNKGTTDRIHLVIDARVNSWVESLFDPFANTAV